MSSLSLVAAAAKDYMTVVPLGYPTKEDLFDFYWEQVDERYDPRLLSEDLINESNRADQGQGRYTAEHCYFEDRKYEHGQKVSQPFYIHFSTLSTQRHFKALQHHHHPYMPQIRQTTTNTESHVST